MNPNTNLVPPHVIVAAKRGFLRTTLQAYASTIPTGGVSAAVLAQFAADPKAFVLVVAAAIISPVFSGLSSYLNIISAGIPQDYQPQEGRDG